VSDLHEQFGDWLADHFDPARTANGKIKYRSGVRLYPREAYRQVRKLIGTAVDAATLRRFRAGERVPPRIRGRIADIVQLGDPDAIRRHRRDEALAEKLARGKRHHERFGAAPDGGPLSGWARSVRARLDGRFEVEAEPSGQAGDLWESMVIPRANQMRQERWGVAA